MAADGGGGVEYHNKLAGNWDNRYHSGGFRKRAEFFREFILPQLPSGGSWLDAGCGIGYFAQILASNERKVVGVDASEGMIDPYSVFNNYKQIKERCESVHMLNTLNAGPNLYHTAPHVALLGVKRLQVK
jgi:2-polyprenyl-3-methyl-5-hydroxy-6-metoxy-1,4-benzoquinol methylase